MDISVVVPLYNEEESLPECTHGLNGNESQWFFIRSNFRK
jgi:glycosyltransferase involved in cell wall biosynthesis